MSDHSCKNELNLQLQAMEARLKQTEKNVGGLAHSLSTLALGCSTATGFNGTDPIVTFLLTGGLAVTAGWNKLLDMVPAVSIDTMKSVAFQLAMSQLGSVFMVVAEVEAAMNNILDMVNYYTGLLNTVLLDIQNLDPLSPTYLVDLATLTAKKLDLEKQLSQLTNAQDCLRGAATAINHLATCQSSSSRISSS